MTEIKLASPMNRLDGMSRSDYSTYYVEEHTQAASGLPGNYRYVGSPAIRAANGGDPSFDGFAEMYYSTVDDVRAAYTSDAWETARRDHPSIVCGRIMFLVEEHELLPPPSIETNPVRYLAFLNRRDTQSRDDFRSYWLEKHMPLALETPELRGYRASVGICSANGDSLMREQPDAPQFDGIVEMWFDDVASFDRAHGSDHWRQLAADYYQNFAMGRVDLLVQSHLVFDLTAED